VGCYGQTRGVEVRMLTASPSKNFIRTVRANDARDAPSFARWVRQSHGFVG
jgi:hypothetical protein